MTPNASAFLRFWKAQDALCQMYGLSPLTFSEIRDAWDDHCIATSKALSPARRSCNLH